MLKPPGKWYALGAAWLRFMLEEGFGLDEYEHMYEIKIESEKVLKIRTEAQMMEFFKRYRTGDTINWAHVMHEHAGLEIHRPKDFLLEGPDDQGLDRFGRVFLLSWEVSSGVVWDTGVIRSVRKLRDGSLQRFLKRRASLRRDRRQK